METDPAAPAGSCIKSTGSSCRAKRNVALFVLTQHRVVVHSASSGEEIWTAFPSPPFSLVAQHVVELSRASLGNAADGLLIAKQLLFSRVSPLFPDRNTPRHGGEALWLNPLSHVARWGLSP